MFQALLKRTVSSLHGRMIHGDQTLDQTGIAPHGIPVLAFSLDRKTRGAFPYSFFEDTPYNEITYNMLEKRYDDYQEYRRNIGNALADVVDYLPHL